MSEKLCLQWNDFKDNVNAAFASLRNDKEFADVTLAFEDGHQIEAHKVILASSSPFFGEILQPEEQTSSPTDLPHRISVKRLCLHFGLSLLWRGKCPPRRFGLLPFHCWGDQAEGSDWANHKWFDRRTGKINQSTNLQGIVWDINSLPTESKTQRKWPKHEIHSISSTKPFNNWPASTWSGGKVVDEERAKGNPKWQKS